MHRPASVHSLAVHLLDGAADATKGHTAVHFLDGVAETATVPLVAARRNAPPSTSWTGRPRQLEGHATFHPLDGVAETTELRRCPVVHLLMAATKAM